MSARFQVARNMNVDELIELYDGIIKDVSESLIESQISEALPIPAAPTGIEAVVEYGENQDPLIPEDLTELDSVSIGKLFSFISNWANYVQSELTRAKCMPQPRHNQQCIIWDEFGRRVPG